MKNAVLGIIGSGMLLYLLLLSVSLYSISSRENELDNCLSQIVEDTLVQFYQRDEVTEEKLEAFVEQSLSTRIKSESDVEFQIVAWDMERGLLSIWVEEKYVLPTGKEKVLRVQKTAVVDADAL